MTNRGDERVGTKNVLASRQWEASALSAAPYLLDVSKRCGPDRKAKTGRLNERQYALSSGLAERMKAAPRGLEPNSTPDLHTTCVHRRRSG